MDDFKGGKFIIGSDIRVDEQRRMANEYMRSQNESQRMAAEGSRNNATANALGIANTHSRSNFLTQIGLFIAVVLTVIILAVIAILAYEKAYNNQSLVDLNNLRDLTLTNLDVLNTADIKTLDITGETTTKNITTTGNINVSDDLIVTGGVSINEGLSVGQKAIFEDDIWVKGGVSINEGLSVGGTINLYGPLVSTQGVSIEGGLSVGQKAIFEDDIWVKGGVSINEGLSVGGTTNLYGPLVSTQGVSIEDGLSVGQKAIFEDDIWVKGGVSINEGLSVGGTTRLEIAKIRKSNLILSSTLPGISTGYNLNINEGGNRYVIENNDASGTSFSNRFNLPNLSGNDERGLQYNFIWGENDSDNHVNFQLHTASSQNNQLYGTVLSSGKNESPITLVKSQDTEPQYGYGNAYLFHYDGVLYPSSNLNCTYIDGNWFLEGCLGTSTHDSDNGFVGSNNPEWLSFGTCQNNKKRDEIIFSNNGENFKEANTTIGNELFILGKKAFGLSSDGTSIWAVGGTTKEGDVTNIYYSNNGTCWQPAEGNKIAGYSIAYGSSQGVSIWVAVGLATDNIIYSTNGISYQSATGDLFKGGDSPQGFDVAYGLSSNGMSLWVAVGKGTSQFLYSDNGQSWNYGSGVSFYSNGNANGIAYGVCSGGTKRWVTTGNAGSGTSNLLYSDDGINWNYCKGATFGDQGKAVAYGLSSNGMSLWVAGGIANDNKLLLYSVDGISFEYCSINEGWGSSSQIFDVSYGKFQNTSRWVAVGKNKENTRKNILYSDDGINWNTITKGDSFQSGGAVNIDYYKPLYPNIDNAVEN